MSVVAWIAAKFGVSQLKLFVIAGLAVAIVTAISLGYFHYQGLLNKVSVLTANSAKFEGAITQQKQTIVAAEEAIQEWKGVQATFQAKVDEASRVAQEARAEAKRLNDVFDQHDLSALAKARPDLIEHRLNAGTRDAARLLRCASGSRDQDCPSQDRAP